MIKEIIIGGEKTWRSYSTNSLRQCHCMSQNSTFYRGTEKYTDITIFIIKDSDEGRKFTDFLEENIDDEDEVKKYLLGITLKYIDADMFLQVCKEQLEWGKNLGRKEFQSDLRRLVGM